jgi:hypothetical protein
MLLFVLGAASLAAQIQINVDPGDQCPALRRTP